MIQYEAELLALYPWGFFINDNQLVQFSVEFYRHSFPLIHKIKRICHNYKPGPTSVSIAIGIVASTFPTINLFFSSRLNETQRFLCRNLHRLPDTFYVLLEIAIITCLISFMWWIWEAFYCFNQATHSNINDFLSISFTNPLISMDKLPNYDILITNTTKDS